MPVVMLTEDSAKGIAERLRQTLQARKAFRRTHIDLHLQEWLSASR